MIELAVVGLILAPPESPVPAFWSTLDPKAFVKRCASDTPEHAEAMEAWQALSQEAAGLTEETNVASATDALDALLRLPCYHLALEVGVPPEFDHPLSFRTWWDEGGGDWLKSYLTPLEAVDDTERILVAADPRTALAIAAPDHPLLCPASDVDCGADTVDWAERARQALEDPLEIPDEAADKPRPCDEEARRRDGDAYVRWRTCMADSRRQMAVLPLGRTKAPRSGRLVINEGGVPGSCEVTSTFDLDTGAASVVERCAADTGPGRTRRRGRVDVNQAREATWMLTLTDLVESVRPAAILSVPDGMKVQGRPMGWPLTLEGLGCGAFAMATSWQWVSSDGHKIADGTLFPFGAAYEHDQTLVDAVESGFVDEDNAAIEQ